MLKDKKMSNEAIAGGLAGLVTRLVFSPFDVLKIRMQNQVNFKVGEYESVFTGLKNIRKNEGTSALWKGAIPGLLLWGVYSAAQFPLYHESKRIMNRLEYSGPSLPLLCGAISGTLAQTISHPFDTLRTRMISYNSFDKNYSLNVVRLTSNIIRTEGIKGLYAGLQPTLFQIAPNVGLTFYFYENLHFFSQVPSLDYLFRGGIAGFLAKCITFPLDTVKKRMQLNGGIESVRKYGSILDCVTHMFKEEGTVSFYRGISPQLYKTVFSSACAFYVFETTMRTLS